MYDNPLGIGWGGFNSYYIEQVKKSEVKFVMTDDLTSYDELFVDLHEMTPKSYLFELFVSTGILGILLFVFLLTLIFKEIKNQDILSTTIFGILLLSLISEGIPYLSFFILIYFLAREKNKN